MHYAGIELGSLGSPLVFTVDGSKVSGLVYYGVGFNCPGFEEVRIGLPGYKLPQSGTRQGDAIDLAYTDANGTLELKGTLHGNAASGTIGGTLNGCNLGQRSVARGRGRWRGGQSPQAQAAEVRPLGRNRFLRPRGGQLPGAPQVDLRRPGR